MALTAFSCGQQAGNSGAYGYGARTVFLINRDPLYARADKGISTEAYSARGLQDGSGRDFPLPDELCYVINITGDNLTRVTGSEDTCGAPNGVGMVVGAFHAGDEAQITVPLGPARRFELIGYPSPFTERDTDGRVKCGVVESIVQPAGANPRVVVLVGGQRVSTPAIFAAGTHDIVPGDNLITLNAIPANPNASDWSYSFGEAWLRANSPSPPAGCTGSSKTAVDSDGDGLTDVQEIALGTNPFAADTDGDGLSDLQETQLGTNPLLLDTDGDGYADGLEVSAGSDPLSPINSSSFLAGSASHSLVVFGASCAASFLSSGGYLATSTNHSLETLSMAPADGQATSSGHTIELSY